MYNGETGILKFEVKLNIMVRLYFSNLVITDFPVFPDTDVIFVSNNVYFIESIVLQLSTEQTALSKARVLDTTNLFQCRLILLKC